MDAVGSKDILTPRKIAIIKMKKNKLAMFGFLFLILITFFSVFAPMFTDYTVDDIDLYSIECSPSKEHVLGTDEIGRDVFTRLVYGGRVSLTVGVTATAIQLIIGILLGVISGYCGGIVDKIIMRIVDIIMCFPFFVIAIAMASILGPSIWNIVIIIGILSWTKLARIVRAEVMALKEREFIQAAKILGATPIRIIIKHLIPNITSSIIVYSTISIADGILSEAALSFLGMGVRPPQPSWGNMLAAAQNMRALQSQWWLWLPPGILVLLTVLSINFIGDGLRDALDPKFDI
ncbi:MAG: ABC transporter permease [Tepidibacter sp.]|jgi:peptide/nickel transport system permease protein|uniref:oligopeptide ABC transporter permease n=1 Tax=Tepidibacter sp. TaxID=2529387 RepID=UPI0025F09EAF|nr:oligopeptide ABC transporter permease [Tepidibacter sp.]MCT4507871.1 ABC transporter permease [Tepidibacter sp.]